MSNLTDSFLHDQEDQLPQETLLTTVTLISPASRRHSTSAIANTILTTPIFPSSSFRPNFTTPPRVKPVSPSIFLQATRSNVVIVNQYKQPDDKENTDPFSQEDDTNVVSSTLIEKWNSEYGNTRYKKKANQLIEKMRQLGNLKPCGPNLGVSEIDIPEARMGLLILAGLNDPVCKMNALNALLEILKNDSLEKSSCNRLVELAVGLLNLMARDVIQLSDLDAQIKLSEVCNLLTETLHHHFGKKHINGIIKELKSSLSHASASLEKLNRLENIKIEFNTQCALESIHRLKDDRQELFEIVERIYKLITVAGAFAMQDAEYSFPALDTVLDGINPHSPSSWYNSVLILKSLAKDVKDQPQQLTPILVLIGKKFKKLNWKFSYAAVQILTEIVLNGQTEAVRLRAFKGIKQFGKDFPGLAILADCNELKHLPNFDPMIHLKLPKKVDYNIRIREACVESLITLIENSSDSEIVSQAKRTLKSREKKEKIPHILAKIQSFTKSSESSREDDYTIPATAAGTSRTSSESSLDDDVESNDYTVPAAAAAAGTSTSSSESSLDDDDDINSRYSYSTLV